MGRRPRGIWDLAAADGRRMRMAPWYMMSGVIGGGGGVYGSVCQRCVFTLWGLSGSDP